MNTERCPHSELAPGIQLPWHWLASHGTRIAKRSLRPGCWLAWLAVLILGGAIRGDAASLLGEWPEFLGPTGQGLSDAKRVPWQWSTTNNIAWRMSMPGKGWSSPVLSRGRLYLTTAVAGPENLSLRVLCLEASDGRVVWDVEVASRPTGSVPRGHSKNGDASPTPVVRGDRLYVHFGHLGTAALDLTGKILWRSTELNYPPVHGNGGSPALVGDALIFSADGASDPFIVALDARTGKVRWKRARTSSARKKFSFSTPLAIHVGEAWQVISPGSGVVAAYDPRDGRELWRVLYGEGYSVVPRPAFAHGLVFVSSGFDHPALLAIRAEGAVGDVTETRVAWRSSRGAPNTPSMVVVGGEIYFISDAGVATCADARTGAVHWSERLGGNFSASPVSAEGRVYFQNEAGVGFVVKCGPAFELLAQNDLGERTLASYAVAEGALFIRSESHLWRVGATAAGAAGRR